VALGGNLDGAAGPVAAVFDLALGALADDHVRVLARSRLWRSAAWPDASDPPYLNAVALVATALGPEPLLEVLHRLEARFGRRRTSTNAPRTLDLDLIAYGREVRAGPVVLPHPRAAERRFVMGPLAELLPHWRHPVSGRTARSLAEAATVGRDACPL
jgi:2-amino-4-hydroxy-6-hydroxymethyldihydropteridine diphosphokinase